MNIVRLEVEEGFLDGLDLSFGPGLNVLIGSRGTGKSSVIELIAWALGLASSSDRFEARRQEHVEAVLGSGRVSLTVQSEGTAATITRATADDSPRYSRQLEFTEPLVLSQNEIELLGLEAPGRLRLIDGFRTDSNSASEISILAELASLTRQIASTTAEIIEVETEANELDSARQALSEAQLTRSTFDESLAGLTKEQTRLKQLNQRLADSEGISEALAEWSEHTSSWTDDINIAISSIPTSPRSTEFATHIAAVDSQLTEARSFLERADELATSALANIEQIKTLVEETTVAAQDESRELRRVLDSASEGAGAAARNVAELEARLARIDRLTMRMTDLEQVRQRLVEDRSGLVDRLEQTRASRVDARSQIISELNARFGPTIRFRLDALGDTAEYANHIAESLRGSGVHYNTLAPQMASDLSPFELINLVESFDVEGLAAAMRVPSARSARIIAALNEGGLEGIASTRIGDRAEISLLDETEYKSSSEMSTGQRCTAVLPVLLRHDERLVIIDQPEDNLDNAYIVHTVVDAMSNRREGSQLICATHNPNIPVLAGATQIIQLGSDGRHGFVVRRGQLEESAIVRAIVDLMEGGRRAFELRSQFYNEDHE